MESHITRMLFALPAPYSKFCNMAWWWSFFF